MLDSRTVEKAVTTGRRRHLRVAMVIQRFRPHFSGQGEQVELLSRALATRGLDVTVITSAYQRPTSVEQGDGYRVVRLHADVPLLGGTRLGSRARGPVFATRTLAHLMRRSTFDLVHVHGLTDALFASWLWCRLRRRPVLFEMTLMDVDDPVTVMASSQRWARLRHAIFRRCDGYVAMSPALADRYHEAGFPTPKMRLVPQGVDVSAFAPTEDRAALRQELDLPASGPILSFVGSLIHRKGIDVLLRAWKDIHTAHPGAYLLLIGRNHFPENPTAARFLADHLARLPAAAADHVHQLGVRDDVSRLLQASDLFVFTSRQEGFGTVMIEAMACGLPCIVVELSGITDFVFGGDSRAGVVVPQADHAAVVTAVNDVLARPAYAVELGRQARRRCIEQFGISSIADRYVDYYADLVAGHETARLA